MEERPFDTLGPPSDPIPFPQAKYYYGKRANVLVYNPKTGQHDIVRDVLFRDYSRTTFGEEDDGDSQVKEAYWKVSHKSPIKTIMGHVEICRVLERCSKEESQSEDDDSSYGDDDVVFQWTERLVAVKVNYCQRMEQLRNRHAEDPLKEIAAMQLIGDEHPHVLGCEDVLFDGKNLNVVLRYCDSGDLFQLLQDVQASRAELAGEHPPGLSEGETRYWFRQIISGLQHLHSVGICHRDLSPENVMIDKQGTLIIDMGMCLRVPYQIADGADRTTDIMEATALANGNGETPLRCLFKPQGACGKLPYMSPEIFRNRDSFDGEAADLWTAGTILFCMVTGNRSYQRPHASDPQFYWMTHGLSQLLSDWGVRLSPEGEHLLKNLLQVDPRLRLTLKEVVHHPWFLLPDEPPTRGDEPMFDII
jgi:serine/threonine protein kinase